MHEFNQSLKYDKRMYAADVAGSISYARALAKGGILTEDEKNKIVDGLTRVRAEWEQGTVCSLSILTCVYWLTVSPVPGPGWR